MNVALAEVFTMGIKAGVEPLDLWQAVRQGATGRARTFDRKADADAFDLEPRRARQMGPELAQRLLLRPATLREFVDGGFRAHAVGLTPDTRRHYRWALENHLGELLDEPLTALGVPRLRWHQQYLLDHGRTRARCARR